MSLTLFLSLEENDSTSLEICKNVIHVAQQNSHIVHSIISVSNKEEGGYNNKGYYGDIKCAEYKSSTCLRNLSLDDIYEICTYHTGKENQHFKISF